MNIIKTLLNLSNENFVEESMSSHEKYPALFSGEMKIPDTDCEVFIRDKVELIFQKSRERWSGLEVMSFCYGIDSANRKLKYTIGVSSENITFSIYILDFIKRFLPKLERGEDVNIQSDGESEEEAEVEAAPEAFESKHKKPSTLVQIQEDSITVKNWIDSFIRSRREIINAQNVKEFCLPSSSRQNCARVDAVLVKRKDTSSHIRVEHVSNLWGPQIRNEFSPLKNKPDANEHSYSVPKRNINSAIGWEPDTEVPLKKKKIYSSQDVASKLEELKMKYCPGSTSSTIN